MAPVKVQVTEQDIRDGWAWSYARLMEYKNPRPWLAEERHKHCPVALAMKRAFKYRGVSAMTYRLGGKSREYRTPELVSDWMMTFDYGFKVEPFDFEITEDSLIKD